MPNTQQPQGVTLAINNAPTAGFYPIEFIEDGQATIPNLVNISARGHNGEINVVVNDGLLRNSNEKMIFSVDNRGGAALKLNLYVVKTAFTDFASAIENVDHYFSRVFKLNIASDRQCNVVLQKIGEQLLCEYPFSAQNNTDVDFKDLYVNCTYDKQTGEMIYTGGKLSFTQADGSVWEVDGAMASLAMPSHAFKFEMQRSNQTYTLQAIMDDSLSAYDAMMKPFEKQNGIRLQCASVDGEHDIIAYRIISKNYVSGNTHWGEIMTIHENIVSIAHTDSTFTECQSDIQPRYLHLFMLSEITTPSIGLVSKFKITPL